jgi:hypothetical protein
MIQEIRSGTKLYSENLKAEDRDINGRPVLECGIFTGFSSVSRIVVVVLQVP